MDHLAQTTEQPNFYLKITAGPNKGATFKIMAREITIGRSRSNDISLAEDTACSRQHAKLIFFDGKFTIESMNESNLIKVNKQPCLRAEVLNRTEIELGGTTLTFLAEFKPPQLATGAQNSSRPSTPTPPPFKATSLKKSNPVRLILYLLIGLIVIFVLLDNPAKKDPAILRTQDQIDAEIKAAKEQEELAQAARKNINRSETARQAQANYVKGFRDYRKGVYNRAIEAFQACLSLEPNNLLCLRYLKLSERRISEVIQQNMILGRSYFEQNQFSACSNAFSNVMISVRDQSSPLYQEAKANFNACQAQLQGRF